MDHSYKSFTISEYNIINNTIISNTTETNYDITNYITYYSYRLCICLMVFIIELTFISILWILTYYLVLRHYNWVRELFETI
jgi:hypothetical protein